MRAQGISPLPTLWETGMELLVARFCLAQLLQAFGEVNQGMAILLSNWKNKTHPKATMLSYQSWSRL